MTAIFVIQTSPEAFQASILRDVQSQIDQLRSEFHPHQSTQFLTRNQVAMLLNVDLKTVYNWTRQRKLKAYRYAHRVFFKRHEVIKVMTH